MTNQGFVELEAIFSGQVQGVGFRATARHHAKALGLKGTVRNRPNGSVELHAVGRKEQLERLLEILNKEEFPGYIDQMDIQYISPHQDYSDFLITR